MSSQNLLSATIPTEMKDQIVTNLTAIKEQLNFLLALQVDDVKGLFKAGNGYYPFIERAYLTVKDHPEIMSGAFNIDEFVRDYMLAKDLTQICNKINELSLGLDRTLTAVLSDALAGGLDIYAAVKLNKDRIPGLELVAQEMGVFFYRPKRTSTTASASKEVVS